MSDIPLIEMLESTDQDPEYEASKTEAYMRGIFTRDKLREILSWMDTPETEQ